MTIDGIKLELGVSTITPTKDKREDGTTNEEWCSAFLPTVKAIVSMHIDVYKAARNSKNLHLVARGDVLVKDVPYRRFILAEHKEVDPERVLEGI